MIKQALILSTMALTAASAQATVIFSENFGTTAATPTASTFTTQNTWSYSDSVDTTVNSNASRLFNPGGAGSGENTVGWISALQSPNTFQQIATTGTFSGLPALNAGEQYVFTLTYYASGQAAAIANDVNAYVNFTSAGKSFSFVSGSNGAITNPANFASQTLSDSNVAADTIGINFVAQGGPGGYNTDRTYTTTWTSADTLTGNYNLTFGRTTDVGTPTFFLLDNISLDVSVQAIPEPSTYGLIGAGALGAVALVRRRRKTVA